MLTAGFLGHRKIAGVRWLNSRLKRPAHRTLATLALAVRCSNSQSRQSAELFSSRRNWDSPNPSPAGECSPPPPPPPPVPGGGAHSLARERGGRVTMPTRGHTLWYSLNICTLCSNYSARPHLNWTTMTHLPLFQYGD
jgi:hypothetical protein